MNRLIKLLAVIYFLLPLGFVQQAKPEKDPIAPVLPSLDLPDRSQWIKTRVTNTGDASSKEQAKDSNKEAGEGVANPFRIKTISSTKSGENRRVIVTFLNGKQAEHWLFEDYLIQGRVPGSKSPVKAQLRGHTELPDWIQSPDLVEFAWLKAKHFVSLAPINGTQAHYFKGQLLMPDPEGIVEHIAVEKEAWIDSKRRLPLRIKVGNDVWDYSYKIGNAAFLSISNEARASIAALKKEIKKSHNVPR
ncbi:MAG: hypothetical protein AAF558_13420 [Verrucomicrobiota bacterium]